MSFQDYLMGLPAEDARFAAISLLNEVFGFEGGNADRLRHGLGLEPGQARLLATLIAHPGRILSRSVLLSAAALRPHADDEPDMKMVDVYVSRIRGRVHRLRPDLEGFLQTVWGVGYRLHPDHVAGLSDLVASLAGGPDDDARAWMSTSIGTAWSDEDDRKLRVLFAQGLDPHVMSFRLGRTYRAVTHRAQILGLHH